MPKPIKPTSKTVARSNQKVSKLVSQTQAAIHCGYSPTAFRYQVNQLGEVPGIDRSGGRHGWKFDLEVLDEYRHRTGNLQNKKDDDGDEESPSYRIKSSQADQLEMKLAVMRGELIPREFAIRETSATFAAWAREMDIVPDQVGRKLNLTPAAIQLITKLLDEARVNAYNRLVKSGLMVKK